jgi:hypothetical protein
VSFTVAGQYNVDIRADLRCFKYCDTLLPKDQRTLTRSVAFDVVPAKAHQIVLSPLDAARPKKRKKRPKTAEANQVQSSVSNADPHRELCPDLSVCIVDEFGNLTTSADFMEVHLRLQYDGDEDAGDVSVDMIEGNTSAEATNGKASFGPLRIKETSNAPSGPYQICVTAEGVRPLLIPFAFSNDTVKTMMHSRLTDKRQDVESAIQTMQDQLQGVRTKCAALEKESEKKLRQVQQLRKSMDVKNANWENFNPAALVLLCNQQMQALTYNEKVRRHPQYGLKEDRALTEMNHALQEQGEEVSGVIGVIAELGNVENEDLDEVLAATMGVTRMKTVVVANKEAVTQWRRRLSKNHEQTSLLPLDNVAKGVEPKKEIPLQKQVTLLRI